jgi:hypothetical protein
VKKGSEEKILTRESFIIERIRKERALNSNKYKNRIFIRNEKMPPS